MSNVRKFGYFKPVKRQEMPRWKPGKKASQNKPGGRKRVHT